MEFVEVRTQEELDKALARDGVVPICVGSAYFRAPGSATVRASGSATVWASDSATVWAYGSATVEAYNSATVRAYDSATVRAYGSATVEASKYVAVTKHPGRAKVTGGVLIELPEIRTAEQWCDFHGVEITDGHVTLYKSVSGDEYKSGYGFAYPPGETVSAPDWDGGKAECGGGLHFCPRPVHCLKFHEGDRFVACRVKLSDIAVSFPASYPHKVKAPSCEVMFECDLDGEPVAAAERAALAGSEAASPDPEEVTMTRKERG